MAYGLRLTVDYTASVPLRTVESPSHLISTELDGAMHARITLVHDTTALDQDFVLTQVTQLRPGSPIK